MRYGDLSVCLISVANSGPEDGSGPPVFITGIFLGDTFTCVHVFVCNITNRLSRNAGYYMQTLITRVITYARGRRYLH